MFYRDRFLLAFLVSLLFHALIILLIFLIPPTKKQKLTPLSIELTGGSLDKTKHKPGGAIVPFNPKTALPTPKPTQLPTPPPTPPTPKTQPKPKKPVSKPIAKPTPKPVPKTLASKKVETKKELSKDGILPPPSPNSTANETRNEQASNEQTPSTDVNLQSLRPADQEDFHPYQVPPSPQQSFSQANLSLQDSINALPPSAREDIADLYGEKFGNMSLEDKKYIVDSYMLNGQVFQYYANRLGYPSIAAYFGQQGVGVVEFTLYPDGHISDIKIIKSSSFSAIDDQIIELVKLAAKDLKRPPKPIPIRLRGNYFIRR
ncbi:hypothetical protein BKH43_07625 [Helicobacter sp. 13S00401-1]|uniref:energy transducer TonB n=1 Tax=Helicobacter sp. 13S00401-1 TaxID=1905758 RepID=UPI000BA76C00|nr:energy transducer TonB [Helicobacter sp. 13S00401-1]PAF48794.1 hypothetical protein BKH43_07625 [Helicobacter sp. 13S00401-1]